MILALVRGSARKPCATPSFGTGASAPLMDVAIARSSKFRCDRTWPVQWDSGPALSVFITCCKAPLPSAIDCGAAAMACRVAIGAHADVVVLASMSKLPLLWLSIIY